MVQVLKINHEDLIRLGKKIKSKFPDTVFEKGISFEEIDRFEKDTHIKLPNDVVNFYKWHNGIKMDEKFQILSLKESYLLFKELNAIPNKLQRKRLKERITTFSPSSECEIEAFLKEESFDQNNLKTTELWLPFLIIDPSIIYVISIKKAIDLKKSNLQSTKIQLENIDLPFEYLRINKQSLLITDSFSSIIRIFEEYIEPPKQSFKKKLKSFTRDIKSILDSIS